MILKNKTYFSITKKKSNLPVVPVPIVVCPMDTEVGWLVVGFAVVVVSTAKVVVPGNVVVTGEVPVVVVSTEV